MSTRVPDVVQDMKPETVEGLQELIKSLQDSVNYHTEAAERIDDDFVKREMMAIANERKEICETIGGYVTMADKEPCEDGTYLGSLRNVWTAFRAGLNGGDPTVVLIEAERAEDSILHKFKEILVDISGNPVNDKLVGFYEKVKQGHDRILALRNAFQNK